MGPAAAAKNVRAAVPGLDAALERSYEEVRALRAARAPLLDHIP